MTSPSFDAVDTGPAGPSSAAAGGGQDSPGASVRSPSKTGLPHVRSRHPVNQAHYDDAPLGARIADRVTGFMGSWTFIVVQTIIVVVWISGNVYELFHFDVYPFILLNLAFSTQAAYAAPLILLAGNRAAIRDRLTLEHAASEADIEDRQNQELLEGNAAILQRIESLERTNVGLSETILRIERSILTALPGAGSEAGASRPTSGTNGPGTAGPAGAPGSAPAA